MKLNQQLLQINRNFIICFIVSALFSAGIAQLLKESENHINATVTITAGYAIYFAIFSVLFYLDNKKRYHQMKSGSIRKEIVSIISSFGLGEVVYLTIRWPTLFYFLEFEMEPFISSISSEIIATIAYMTTVTIFLRKTKTF